MRVGASRRPWDADPKSLLDTGAFLLGVTSTFFLGASGTWLSFSHSHPSSMWLSMRLIFAACDGVVRPLTPVNVTAGLVTIALSRLPMGDLIETRELKDLRLLG